MDEATLTCAVEEAVVDVARVRVVEGPDAGLEQPIEGDVATIGSGPAAQIRIPSDPTVSRLHCEIRRTDVGTVRLRDLGSKNGAWVGGARVYDVELPAGGRIRIGDTLLEIGLSRDRKRRTVWTGPDRFGDLYGASPAMHRIFAMLARIVGTDEPVLVRGESGTGKELVARALHQLGPRREGPFVIVDGAALSSTLADAELFGHMRGAFTGAVSDRAGAFERAAGGTVFLDEIGELPPEVQPKLLRVLEEGTFQRLGSNERKRVDVRVVSATHRDLRRMINEGTFREDLWYRLAVFEIEMPPLRDRGEDVAVIARAMAESFSGGDAQALEIVEQAVLAYEGYPWPGNVRELRMFVRRVLALGHTALPGGDLEPDSPAASTFNEAKARVVERFERVYLARLLEETGGNLSEAARRAEMNRGHLSELVKRYGIKGRT